LLTASFRSHLAMDTLAVRLTIPPVGFVGDFHSLVSTPCRAYPKKKEAAFSDNLFSLYKSVFSDVTGGAQPGWSK